MFVRNMVGALAAAVAFGFVLFAQKPEEITMQQRDLERMTQGNYQLVYLTMFSEEYASGYPFEYYMGWDTYKSEHCIENLAELSDYVDTALAEQEEVIQIFTLLDPAKISEVFAQDSVLTQGAYRETLKASINSHPDVEFVYMLPAYSLDYWCGMDDKQVQESLDSYLLFCNEFQDLANVRIYFFGHCEWVNANPANYEGVEDCSEDILIRMIALSIFNDKYLVTGDEMMPLYLEELRGQILQEKEEPEETCDLSQYEIVFFGDSNMANYFGPLSVPGIVAAKTGAITYNCGVGGQSAANITSDGITTGLETTISYFLGENRETLEVHKQFRTEVERFHSAEHDGKKLVFFVGYGTNDYFFGNKVESPEVPNDVTTYKGALNVAVERLQQAYPEAEVIILAPIFGAAFEFGQGRNSEVGGILQDYVDAAVQTAVSQEISYINCYTDLPMNESNYTIYLEDGVHLSENGRFEYANMLIDFMGDYLSK